MCVLHATHCKCTQRRQNERRGITRLVLLRVSCTAYIGEKPFNKIIQYESFNYEFRTFRLGEFESWMGGLGLLYLVVETLR